MKLVVSAVVNLETIRSIAMNTRIELEKELKSLANDPKVCYRDWQDFSGACAIANYRLWLRIKQFGVKLVASYEHVFCYLPQERLVIDISATQYGPFSKDKVLILPLQKIKEAGPATYYPYEIEQIFKSQAEIAAFFEKWPEDQIPFELLKDKV